MIAIKNIKKFPKKCIECDLRMIDKCYYLKSPYKLNGLNLFEEKPKDCPLVEIVTCKDCKYNYENSCDFDGFGIDDDYFCAKGERKEQ